MIAYMQSRGRGLLRVSGCAGAHEASPNFNSDDVALKANARKAKTRRFMSIIAKRAEVLRISIPFQA